MSPPKTLNKFSTFIDIQKFIRKLSIQRHFLSFPSNTSSAINDVHIHTGLSNPSLFNLMAPAISVFRSLLLRDLDKLPSKKTYTDPNIKIGLRGWVCAVVAEVGEEHDRGARLTEWRREAPVGQAAASGARGRDMWQR